MIAWIESRVACWTWPSVIGWPRAAAPALTLVAIGLAPVAVERRDQLAVHLHRPVRPAPRRAARLGDHRVRRVLQPLEERAPLGVDRLGVAHVALVELLDVGRIGAVEERSRRESRVRVLACHHPFAGGKVPRLQKSAAVATL